ncbi:MAG: hypothetical protein Q8784_02315 [Vigna little leaf phytoplasma]|nr:hypothetical protein [Vigna little leaf phytoplasma]
MPDVSDIEKKFLENVKESESLKNTSQTEQKNKKNEIINNLQNCIQQYEEKITQIKKYNAKLNQLLFNIEKENIQTLFSMLSPLRNLLRDSLITTLNTEIEQEILNNEQNFYNKGIKCLDDAETQTSDIEKQKKYDTAKLHFEDALEKYQNVKYKLQKLCSYIFENKESITHYNKKISLIWEKQKKITNYLYTFCIVLSFNFIITIIYVSSLFYKNSKKLKQIIIFLNEKTKIQKQNN